MSASSQHVREHLRSQLPQARPHCHRVPRMWAAPDSLMKVIAIVGTLMGFLEIVGFVTVLKWMRTWWP